MAKDASGWRKQIRQNLQDRDTEELLQIWKNNNRREWTDDAFQVVHDILLERLGSVPEQPPYDPEAAEEDGLEEDVPGYDKLAEDDVWHDPEIILKTAGLANGAAWIMLVLGAALVVLRVLSDVNQIQDMTSGGFESLIAVQITYGVIGNAISPILYFIVLRAIAQILYLLLDIERNSYLARPRPASQQQSS